MEDELEMIRAQQVHNHDLDDYDDYGTTSEMHVAPRIFSMVVVVVYSGLIVWVWVHERTSSMSTTLRC